MSDTTNTYSTNNNLGKQNPNDPFSDDSTFPQTSAVLQPRKGKFTPTTLGSTEKTYNGTQDDISAIALWGANQDFSYDVVELPGRVFSITLTIPYDEITGVDNQLTETNIQKWEIKENITSRDIFDVGIYTTPQGQPNSQLGNIRYTVPTFMRPIIRQGLKYGNFGQLNFGQVNGNTLTPSQIAALAPLATLSQQFYYLLLGGTTSVKAATQTVTRTIVYSTTDPNAYDNDPYFQRILTSNSNTYGNISSILSTTDLVNIFQIDSIDAAQLLPSYARCKTLNTTSQFSDSITSFALAGYLMHSPTKTLITPTKVMLQQSFEWDEWLDTLYLNFSPISGFPLIQSTPYPPGFTFPS